MILLRLDFLILTLAAGAVARFIVIQVLKKKIPGQPLPFKEYYAAAFRSSPVAGVVLTLSIAVQVVALGLIAFVLLRGL